MRPSRNWKLHRLNRLRSLRSYRAYIATSFTTPFDSTRQAAGCQYSRSSLASMRRFGGSGSGPIKLVISTTCTMPRRRLPYCDVFLTEAFLGTILKNRPLEFGALFGTEILWNEVEALRLLDAL
jgi:hypothetical protein